MGTGLSRICLFGKEYDGQESSTVGLKILLQYPKQLSVSIDLFQICLC